MTDDWQITYEKVEPHGLCCKECKEARAERDAFKQQIAAIKEAAVQYGVNDEVAAAIAHACLIVRQKEGTAWGPGHPSYDEMGQ
jgi:hypothetical protein